MREGLSCSSLQIHFNEAVNNIYIQAEKGHSCFVGAWISLATIMAMELFDIYLFTFCRKIDSELGTWSKSHGRCHHFVIDMHKGHTILILCRLPSSSCCYWYSSPLSRSLLVWHMWLHFKVDLRLGCQPFVHSVVLNFPLFLKLSVQMYLYLYWMSGCVFCAS